MSSQDDIDDIFFNLFGPCSPSTLDDDLRLRRKRKRRTSPTSTRLTKKPRKGTTKKYTKTSNNSQTSSTPNTSSNLPLRPPTPRYILDDDEFDNTDWTDYDNQVAIIDKCFDDFFKTLPSLPKRTSKPIQPPKILSTQIPTTANIYNPPPLQSQSISTQSIQTIPMLTTSTNQSVRPTLPLKLTSTTTTATTNSTTNTHTLPTKRPPPVKRFTSKTRNSIELMMNPPTMKRPQVTLRPQVLKRSSQTTSTQPPSSSSPSTFHKVQSPHSSTSPNLKNKRPVRIISTPELYSDSSSSGELDELFSLPLPPSNSIPSPPTISIPSHPTVPIASQTRLRNLTTQTSNPQTVQMSCPPYPNVPVLPPKLTTIITNKRPPPVKRYMSKSRNPIDLMMNPPTLKYPQSKKPI